MTPAGQTHTITPVVIGLTGTVGAGKSTVAHSLTALGAHHIDFDVRTADALGTSSVIDAIRQQWGAGVVTDDGQVDRAALADRVFADPDQRAILESIIHPVIWRTREQAAAEAVDRSSPAAVMDAPLLFEVGLDRECDHTVVVDAPFEIRLERVTQSRGWSREELIRREAAQWPATRKRSLATHIIDNTGTREELASRVRTLYDAITGG